MNCPLCAGPLNEVEVRNALSRYVDRYICSPCGNREAMLGLQHNKKACALYYDGTDSGIMLVIHDEPGYARFGSKPESDEFARSYVAAVNERHGLSDAAANSIVASSMFGRWANF